MNNNFFQFLGITKKSGNVIEGYNKCEETLKKNKVFLIILAEECSQNTKDKFKNYSSKYNLPIIEGISKDDLGRFLGKNEIKVIGILNKTMSDKLISLYKEIN